MCHRSFLEEDKRQRPSVKCLLCDFQLVRVATHAQGLVTLGHQLSEGHTRNRYLSRKFQHWPVQQNGWENLSLVSKNHRNAHFPSLTQLPVSAIRLPCITDGNAPSNYPREHGFSIIYLIPNLFRKDGSIFHTKSQHQMSWDLRHQDTC